MTNLIKEISKLLISMKAQFGEAGKKAYMELISYQWEFSILNEVPPVTLKLMR